MPARDVLVCSKGPIAILGESRSRAEILMCFEEVKKWWNSRRKARVDNAPSHRSHRARKRQCSRSASLF